ncbi:MAG TPA: hypothetical protein VN749_21070 [Candidatus Eisenbacteria bacterium]|nr:hypothetical protein [Candidatus Eisenbacteria bacterium]
MTTGATLDACARALRDAGAIGCPVLEWPKPVVGTRAKSAARAGPRYAR